MKAPIREFNPSGRCTAVKSFTLGGKDFTAGSNVPWRQMRVSERKLRQLWETRFINFEPVKFTPKAPVAQGA